MKIYFMLFLFTMIACSRPSETSTVSNPNAGSENRISEKVCKQLDDKVFIFSPTNSMPEHNFTLVFECSNSEIQGTLIGPDPEGEHGLYFFKTQFEASVDSLEMITIKYAMGNLYDKQITFNNYQTFRSDSAGVSKYEYELTGKINGDSLIQMHCYSKSNCYSDSMTFRLKTR